MKMFKRMLSTILAITLVIGLIPLTTHAAVESVAFADFAANAEGFDLYSSSSGGFQVVDGKLTPTGDAGEFKAIYQDAGKPISAVSVEMHPRGNEGMFGGLYIGASNAGNGQDAIDAYYVGIESHFDGWDDAPNRLDITLGQFAQGWVGEQGARYVSETGAANALFTGGNKQPIKIRAQMEGNVLTVTVSLVSDLSRQISTVYTLPEGTDLTLGQVGIRSQFNNSMYDNFTVEYVEEETVEDMAGASVGFENTQAFDLYSTSAGSFVAENGKLVPSGDGGEFKAIYKDTGKVNSVRVELHPHGNDGPIYGGLYIGASDAANGQDQIHALYLGIESHFTGWDDAPNRVDLVVGSFPTWAEHSRTVSETGLSNALFAGGVKEPICLRADITGNVVTVTVSLVRDPSVSFGTTYVADYDLSLGQVGIRSHYNDAMYDNFAVNSVPAADAKVIGFDNADAFDLYTSGNGGFITLDGKLVPAGEPAELKAVYKQTGKATHSVSVELNPVGNDGPIYGGLYIGASNAANGQDQIKAIYIGVESNFTGWEDAPNRVDLVIGRFPAWAEHARTVSETGLGNALFAGGVKEPLRLRADISGNTVTATVSLVSDPSKSVSATYTAEYDLTLGQVGIRSHHNNAVYDNFTVNAAAMVDGQAYSTVSQAVQMAGTSPVKLLGSTDEVVTVSGDTTIDLAGYYLSKVFTTDESSLKLADSTGDDYEPGSGWANVAGPAESFASMDGKQYLAIFSEGIWTAHRYDAVLTHVSLKPAADALGYKAKLMGDAVVQAHTTAFGFRLWVREDNIKTYSTTDKQEISLRLRDILQNEGGEMNINANAFLTLQAGDDIGTYTGKQYTTTMKQALKAVDSRWMSYSQSQADAVLALCEQYLDVVSQWGLDNIFFEGINFADPLDRGEQSVTLASNQTYQNGLDISGQWGVGEYTEGGDYGIGDPFVMRYNGKYYMYPSSGTPENGVAGIKVFSSNDLVNWTYEGFALTAEEATQAYAPEVLYHNGWFYMCQSGNKGTGHYIYRSQSPVGPFEAITDNFGYKIDGSFWLDDVGNLYFLHAGDKAVWIAPLDQQTMLPGTSTKLNASLDGKWVEGPGLFRRGDILYLTYSGNRVTEDNYRIGYSYLFGSDPMGSFIQPEDNVLLLETGPDNFRGLGHNSNFVGPDLDSWYVAYHNLVNTAGPQRRYMLDKLVTNGAEVMANGPTYWRVNTPERPDFEVRDIQSQGLWLSGKASEAVFTAEFNFIPAQGSVTRVVFAYENESDYTEALWNDGTKTLTVNKVVSGQSTTLGTATVSNLSADVLHTLRVEQGATRLIVYVDTMRKIDVQSAGTAGQIGVIGNFGYIAFSNDAFGTSDFDTVKQAGTFPAVHYLKGENRGFAIANATVGGIRQGEKENTVYDAATAGYSLKLDTAGDWVKYAVQVNADGTYDFSALLEGESQGGYQVIVDSRDIYEVTVSEDGTASAQLNLTGGHHTLKIRLREGSLQIRSFTLEVTQ